MERDTGNDFAANMKAVEGAISSGEFTIGAVAHRAGIHRNALSMILRGERFPRPITIRKCANALDSLRTERERMKAEVAKLERDAAASQRKLKAVRRRARKVGA